MYLHHFTLSQSNNIPGVAPCLPRVQAVYIWRIASSLTNSFFILDVPVLPELCSLALMSHSNPTYPQFLFTPPTHATTHPPSFTPTCSGFLQKHQEMCKHFSYRAFPQKDLCDPTGRPEPLRRKQTPTK